MVAMSFVAQETLAVIKGGWESADLYFTKNHFAFPVPSLDDPMRSVYTKKSLRVCLGGTATDD
jgi:hypothetical protein